MKTNINSLWEHLPWLSSSDSDLSKPPLNHFYGVNIQGLARIWKRKKKNRTERVREWESERDKKTGIKRGVKRGVKTGRNWESKKRQKHVETIKWEMLKIIYLWIDQHMQKPTYEIFAAQQSVTARQGTEPRRWAGPTRDQIWIPEGYINNKIKWKEAR